MVMPTIPHFDLQRIRRALHRRSREAGEFRKLRLQTIQGSEAGRGEVKEISLSRAVIGFQGTYGGLADLTDFRQIPSAQLEFMELYPLFREKLEKDFPGIRFTPKDNSFSLAARQVPRFIDEAGIDPAFHRWMQETYPGRNPPQASASEWIKGLQSAQMDNLYEWNGGPIELWLRPYARKDLWPNHQIDYLWPLEEAWRTLRAL